MRVTTAFNKMLGLVGASVEGVTFTPEGVVVALRRRQVRHRCPCGWRTWAIYDRSVRRWRHLDLGSTRCFLEAEICRIDCAHCGRVRTEEVPWARPGARHTKTSKTSSPGWPSAPTRRRSPSSCASAGKQWPTSWPSWCPIGSTRPASRGSCTIGVDEVSYRQGHRFLTVVADHDRNGAVVWAGEGKNAAAPHAFYDLLGTERCQRLEAVSLDMGAAYKSATDAKAPVTRQCVDPFHVVKLANAAVDKSRRWAWNESRRRQRSEKGPLGRSAAHNGNPRRLDQADRAGHCSKTPTP